MSKTRKNETSLFVVLANGPVGPDRPRFSAGLIKFYGPFGQDVRPGPAASFGPSAGPGPAENLGWLRRRPYF